MFCPHCGANMPDHVKFCAGCGRPIPTADVPQNDAPALPKKKTGLIIGLSVFAAVLLIAVIAILILRPGKEKAGGRNADSGQNTQAGQSTQVSGEEQDLPADEKTVIPLLTSITPADGSSEGSSITLTHQADGFHLSSYSYADGSLYQTTENDYDSSGRIVHSLQEITGHGITIERDYQYDENGNLSHYASRQTLEEMPESPVVEDITYTCDPDGRVTQMSAPSDSNLIYELEFNSDGTVKAMKAGFTDATAFARTEYQYEDGYIVSSCYTLTDSDGAVSYEQEFTYDKSSRSIADCGNVLTETTRSNGSESIQNYEYTEAFLTENGILLTETEKPEKSLYQKKEYWQDNLSMEFTYDEEERLIREMEYDDFGNEYKYTDYQYDESGRECLAEHHTYGTDDLLHSYGDYQYDENGNVISKTWYDTHTGERTPLYVYQYTYDADSRLLNRSEVAMDPVYVSHYFEYEYDSDGNLVKESSYDNKDGCYAYTEYVYIYK